MPLNLIEEEHEAVKQIQYKLDNISKVFNMVIYKGRYGIIYEQVVGHDMIKEMLKKIYKVKSYAKSLAALHFKIHEVKIEALKSVREKLYANIDATTALSNLEKDKIKAYTDTLPDDNRLCHFDFHPGNVMLQEESSIVIDWMTACSGNPNADVARTYLLLKFGELQHVNFLVKKVAHVFEKYIGKIYLEAYKSLTGVSDYEIEQWLLPVAAARLIEWISTEEKEKLLMLVKEKLLEIK